jgi:hypothetical protein
MSVNGKIYIPEICDTCVKKAHRRASPGDWLDRNS